MGKEQEMERSKLINAVLRTIDFIFKVVYLIMIFVSIVWKSPLLFITSLIVFLLEVFNVTSFYKSKEPEETKDEE